MSHGQLLVQIHRWEILPSGWGKGSGTEYCVSIGQCCLPSKQRCLERTTLTGGRGRWQVGMKGAPNKWPQPSNTTTARRTALRVFWTDGLLQSCCRRYIRGKEVDGGQQAWMSNAMSDSTSRNHVECMPPCVSDRLALASNIDIALSVPPAWLGRGSCNILEKLKIDFRFREFAKHSWEF